MKAADSAARLGQPRYTLNMSTDLSWDWSDPSVRSYPRLKLKLIAGLLLGGLALGVFAFLFVNRETSAVARVGPVIVGWIIAYPFVVAVVLGNIKRLAATPFSDEERLP